MSDDAARPADAYEYKETELTEQKNTGVSPSDVFIVIGKIFDYAREAKITEREIERYRCNRDIAITEITEKYKFAHALLNKTFEERRMVIEKHFKLIDEGLERNNYELVLKGMDCITSIVKDNPFKYLSLPPQEQRILLESGELPPL